MITTLISLCILSCYFGPKCQGKLLFYLRDDVKICMTLRQGLQLFKNKSSEQGVECITLYPLSNEENILSHSNILCTLSIEIKKKIL